MTPVDRRRFMRNVGVILVSAPAAGLLWKASTPSSLRWRRLRRCWERLAEIDAIAGPSAFAGSKAPYYLVESCASSFHDRLALRHRYVVDDLVLSGLVTRDTADALHQAYEGAVFQMWRLNYHPGCYAVSASSSIAGQNARDLALQLQALEKVARESDVQEPTLGSIREAIERDLATWIEVESRDSDLEAWMLDAAADRGARPDRGDPVTEAAELLVQLYRGTL